LWQALKPLLIQAFVSELSIATLDVAVLHWPASLNQNVANPVQSGPSQEGEACELRTVICANCNWIAPKNCSLIQKLCDILARDAKVHSNVNA
jgi:hypothetical protein